MSARQGKGLAKQVRAETVGNVRRQYDLHNRLASLSCAACYRAIRQSRSTILAILDQRMTVC